MKLYVGSRDYKPEGYLTVDIDANNEPDILANVVNMQGKVEKDSVEEVLASAIFEHLAWPDSFAALVEWRRVLQPGGTLKINIPDLELLCSFIIRGISTHMCICMLYGGGRRTNPFEAHQFSYTKNMLVDMLKVLGFDDFNIWNSPINDASNGWGVGDNGEKYALQLNVECKKMHAPMVPEIDLYETLKSNSDRSFLSNFYSCAEKNHINLAATNLDNGTLAMLYEKMHFNLIDARQRIKYLESQTATTKDASDYQHFQRVRRFLKNCLKRLTVHNQK
jgi:predicted SAM-dependent methyltransferase